MYFQGKGEEHWGHNTRVVRLLLCFVLEGLGGGWVQGAGFLLRVVGFFFTFFFLLLAMWPFFILRVYFDVPFCKCF